MSEIDWLLTVPTCSRCGSENVEVPEKSGRDFIVVCHTCHASLGWWSEIRATLDREAGEVAREMVRGKLKDLTNH